MKRFIVTIDCEYEIDAETEEEAIWEVCDRFDFNDMCEVKEEAWK